MDAAPRARPSVDDQSVHLQADATLTHTNVQVSLVPYSRWQASTPAHANTNLGNVVDILKDFGFFERVVDVRRLQLATRAALVLLARRLLAGVPSSKDASRISAIGKVLCTRATPAGSVDD